MSCSIDYREKLLNTNSSSNTRISCSNISVFASSKSPLDDGCESTCVIRVDSSYDADTADGTCKGNDFEDVVVDCSGS
ncbi:unnamed protein product [Adineta steineri]|uniref:Uncharacterized protein n=1 Tax=Adineta steineri TaxID=433720 RepID=A0A820C3Q6_9BILA|nr:unnamed protein product [Adineta steineri]CAF4210157.1 unnamed protein product [Adineta steineri]